MRTTTAQRWRRLAAALAVAAIPASAHAQLDPAHNHLAGFSVRGGGGLFSPRSVILDTRFGQSPTTVLRPLYLLMPASKTGGPGPDPMPPTPAPPFVCYKIHGGFTPNATVHLVDQFVGADVVVRGPKLLCAPALVGSTSTTVPPSTTSSTSTSMTSTSSSTSSSTTSTSSTSTSSSSSSSSTSTTTTTATSLVTIPTLPTTLPTLPTTLPTLP